MDLWQVLDNRHSIRGYRSDDVDATAITRILEAGVRAPSAGNRQPWHFVVVRRAAKKDELAQAAFGQGFVAEAPVVIVICADAGRSAARYGTRGQALYCLQDTAAAAENMLLAATGLGLGACWVGAFDEGAAAQALQLPGHLRPVCMIPVGHAAEERTMATSRRPLSEVVSFLD